MLSVKLGWRNLWRNKRRTVITLSALALNTAILIITFALMDGYIHNVVRYATDLVTGEAQIHVKGYLEDHSIYKLIENPDRIIEKAEQNDIQAAPRLFGYGLLSSGNKSAGVLFQGIKPDLETKTSTLYNHVGDGNFVNETADKKVVLGKKLARTLNVDVGDELIAVVQAADGSMGTEIFYVAGILKSAGDRIDRSTVFFHIDDYRELFVIESGVHEIALNSFQKTDPYVIRTILGDTIKDLEIKTWRELNPLLSDMLNTSDVGMGIFAAIFFVVAGLGVMNTMLMSTFDRIREFGILKAIGASPFVILRDVLIEAMMLSIVATAMGTIIGLAGSWYLSIHGIDLSGIGGDVSFGGIAFDPLWKAVIHVSSFYKPVITMWIISVLASLYPATIAARLKPVDAITHV